MKRIIFATTNKDKVREVKMMLEGFDVELCTMKEAGVDVDIVEDGLAGPVAIEFFQSSQCIRLGGLQKGEQ